MKTRTIIATSCFLVALLAVPSAALAETGSLIRVRPSNRAWQAIIHDADDNSTIVMAAGTYDADGPIAISGKKNVTIKGEGEVHILLDDTDADVIHIIGSESITISNVHAQHKVPLEDYACHGSVVRIESSDTVRIEQSELNGSGAVGVYIRESKNIFVTSCNIHSNTFNAIYMHDVNDVEIVDNTIKNNANCIQGYEIKGLMMHGNTISNNKGYW